VINFLNFLVGQNFAQYMDDRLRSRNILLRKNNMYWQHMEGDEVSEVPCSDRRVRKKQLFFNPLCNYSRKFRVPCNCWFHQSLFVGLFYIEHKGVPLHNDIATCYKSSIDFISLRLQEISRLSAAIVSDNKCTQNFFTFIIDICRRNFTSKFSLNILVT